MLPTNAASTRALPPWGSREAGGPVRERGMQSGAGEAGLLVNAGRRTG